MKKNISSVIAILLTMVIYANETIHINANQFSIDQDKALILTNLDVSYINSTWTDTKSQIQLDDLYEFINPVEEIELGQAYQVTNTQTNENYTLYFTEFPIISITTDYEIVDEPDVLAYFNLIESDGTHVESHVGIQYRGAWTQTLPKKSMEIEFWTDETGEEDYNQQLLDLISDDDWNFEAGYNEPLRIRSNNNWEIWRMIDGDLYYQEDEPKAVNGIRMRYMELFVNNEYRGIYSLGEKVKRKQLRLKKHNGQIRGELYKAFDWTDATRFNGVTEYDNNSKLWSGWDYKHPKEEINWENFYDLIDFVANSSDADFYANYGDRFHIDNLVSYYIFLNLIRATDNTGKNTFIAKYKKNEKYFYVPWDLDGTIGNIWDGSRENITEGILTNGFFNRAKHDCSENGFWETLRTNWSTLRANELTHANIMALFQSSHDAILNNGGYEREEMAWPEYTYNPEELTYMNNWLQARMDYLDVEFDKSCLPLSTNDLSEQLLAPKLFPNPTNDIVNFDLKQGDEFEVSVFNTAGQLVIQDKLSGNKKNISLNRLGKGTYLIVLKSDKGNHPYKVIVK